MLMKEKDTPQPVHVVVWYPDMSPQKPKQGQIALIYAMGLYS